jgi:hypothetical protein
MSAITLGLTDQFWSFGKLIGCGGAIFGVSKNVSTAAATSAGATIRLSPRYPFGQF